MASFWENIYERQRVEWKKIKLIDGTNLRNDFKLITSTKLWKGIKQGTDNKLGEGIVMKKGIMLRMSIMLKKSIMLRKGIVLSGAKLSSDNALCFSVFRSASRLIPCNLILWWLLNKRWGYVKIKLNPIPMEPLVTFVIDFFLIIPVIADEKIWTLTVR